jgi:hypothetical protein
VPNVRRLRSYLQRIQQGDHVTGPVWFVGGTVAVTSILVGAPTRDLGFGIGLIAALASVATFLFGVLLAFTIDRTRLRLSLIHDLIRRTDSGLLSIHALVEAFPEDAGAIRDGIDRLIVEQVDFRLAECHLAQPAYLSLARSVYALEPVSPRQEISYYHLLQQATMIGEHRALMESAVGQALSPLEWRGLLSLFLLLLALIAVLPGGEVIGSAAAGVLAGVLTSLIILLRKLDRLRWHERTSIWEPQARLLRSMGRDPYVPRHVIDAGRFQPRGRTRVVSYPDPYPMTANKIVTVEEL